MSWGSAPLQPDYRATCSFGELVLIPWRVGLIGRGGPCNQLLSRRARGSSVADLTIVRNAGEGYEAIVAVVSDSADSGFRRTFTAWGASLGYRRLWWRDELVELDPASGTLGGLARTCCRTCGSEWSDDSAEFWAMSVDQGILPIWCPLCGSSVPQWAVDSEVLDDEPIKPSRRSS